MTYREFVVELREEFRKNLERKTGWGKNEVLREFDVSCIMVLSGEVEKEKG